MCSHCKLVFSIVLSSILQCNRHEFYLRLGSFKFQTKSNDLSFWKINSKQKKSLILLLFVFRCIQVQFKLFSAHKESVTSIAVN